MPGVQNKENEAPEPTWVDSLATTPSSEVAATQRALPSPAEDGTEGLEARTPSPILNLQPGKMVHRGKRYLPSSCCTYNEKAETMLYDVTQREHAWL